VYAIRGLAMESVVLRLAMGVDGQHNVPRPHTPCGGHRATAMGDAFTESGDANEFVRDVTRTLLS